VGAQSWPMAPRQCQQCLTDQIKPRGMVQTETKEGEVVRPTLQPIDPQRNGAPAAREPLDRPGTIGTISRSMARADGEVGFEGVGTVALGQLSDGAVQPVSPGGGGEQP
jgi:hypothetical protein